MRDGPELEEGKGGSGKTGNGDTDHNEAREGLSQAKGVGDEQESDGNVKGYYHGWITT